MSASRLDGTDWITELSWTAPESEQTAAKVHLIQSETLNPQDLDINAIDKRQFENAAHVLVERLHKGDRRCIPVLLGWLRDPNWPGGRAVFDTLAAADGVETEVEAMIAQALAEKDEIWAEFLSLLKDVRRERAGLRTGAP